MGGSFRVFHGISSRYSDVPKVSKGFRERSKSFRVFQEGSMDFQRGVREVSRRFKNFKGLFEGDKEASGASRWALRSLRSVL